MSDPTFLQAPGNRVRDAFLIKFRPRLRVRQFQNDFSLPTACNRSVAGERGQHALVPKILAPRLELLRRLALSLA